MSEKILIVDDNKVNRQLERHILSNYYHDIEEAADGDECLKALADQVFDVVLLDLNMPVLSGFDVLKELQHSNDSSKLSPTIIVVSSDSDPATISRAFQLGAADYVTTPFNRDELLARVNTHLSLHNREQELEERVTERTEELLDANKRLQDTHNQLLQSEKMASLGQLSAGVAHEINNPVGYIYSNLDTLSEYLGDIMELISNYQAFGLNSTDKEIHRQMEELNKKLDIEFLTDDIQHLMAESLQGCKQVKRIVSDLKGFSHSGQDDWQPANINEGITSALNIARSELKYKAETSTDYGELPNVECILPQIEQVIVNLLVNAAHAIKHHGNINIRTRLNDDEKFISISIEDDGCGMSSDIQNRIFEPFFTTKQVGEGTGLGLSVSYGIIQNHNGQIDIDSEEGKGTCFNITLPVQQEANRK